MNDRQTKLTEEQERELENLFTYHKPFGDQPERYERVREYGKQFARVILENTPKGADQSAAVRLLRQATMTANEAIATEPREREKSAA